MSAHRYQSSFNGITFNRVYDDQGKPDEPAHLVANYKESDYRLESFDPTRVTLEDFREMRQFLEGAEPNESYEGVLIAIIRGTLLASSPADLEDKTGALRAALSPALCRIASQATDPKGVLPFDFKVDTATAPGYSARRLYCRPAVGRPVIFGRKGEGLSRRYLLQLISFDPKIYSQTLHQQAVTTGQTVVNAGNFYTYPKIRITFSGAGNAALTITIGSTGQVFVINATTAANGEIWELDTRSGTMYRTSDSANRYTARVSGYLAQLYLMPGNNVITYANTGGVSGIRFDFRDAWA